MEPTSAQSADSHFLQFIMGRRHSPPSALPPILSGQVHSGPEEGPSDRDKVYVQQQLHFHLRFCLKALELGAMSESPVISSCALPPALVTEGLCHY